MLIVLCLNRMLIVLCLNPESEAEYEEYYLEKSSSGGHVRAPVVDFEDARGGNRSDKSAMRRSQRTLTATSG
jgi:hypothetical protein